MTEQRDFDADAGTLIEIPSGSELKRWNGSAFRSEAELQATVVGVDPVEPEHVLVLAEEPGLLREAGGAGVLYAVQVGDKLYLPPSLVATQLGAGVKLRPSKRGRLSGLAERALG